MKAFILAAGIGKKFEPISNELPKPMAPVLNKPILLYILENLKSYNIVDIKINLHHLPEYIDSYFGDGENFNLKISYSFEKELLGTAGALNKSLSFFNDTTIVHCGNVLADIDYSDLIKSHKHRNSLFTIVLSEIPFSKHIDSITLNEKESYPLGIFIFEKEFFDKISIPKISDIVPDLLNLAQQTGIEINSYFVKGKIFAIITPKDLLDVNVSLLEDLCLTQNKLFFNGIGNKISDDAIKTIISPLFIGNNNDLKKGVVLMGKNVLGDNITIESNSSITNSLILNDTYIGKGVEVKNSIVFQNLIYDVEKDYGFYIDDKKILKRNQDPRPKNLIINFLVRFTDILLSILGLIVFSPLFLIIAIWIKIDSKGPVFYKSFRIKNPEKKLAGKNWYKFEEQKEVVYYVFRTMYNDMSLSNQKLQEINLYNKGPYFKAEEDPRITKAGKILRKLSLDELPLLINVLKGDLSFVGVWGLPIEEAYKLESEGFKDSQIDLSEFAKFRFKGKLGLAGYWQSRGRSKLTAEERIIHDSIQALNDIDNETLSKNLGEYKKNNSFKGYYSLILNTINSVINRKGSM